MKQNFTRIRTAIMALALVGCAAITRGQAVLYEEDFGTPTANTLIQNYTGWQDTTVAYVGNGTCDVRSSNASTGYGGASGGGNVMINDTVKWLQISGLNTSAAQPTVKLYCGLRKTTAEDGSNFVVEFSTDSVVWVRLPMADTMATGTGTGGWHRVCFPNLPAHPHLHLRFSNLANVDYRLDDLRITDGDEAVFEVAAKARTAGYVVAEADLEGRTGFALEREQDAPGMGAAGTGGLFNARVPDGMPLQSPAIPLQNARTGEGATTGRPGEKPPSAGLLEPSASGEGETRLARAMDRDLRPAARIIAEALRTHDWKAARKQLAGALKECGTESAEALEAEMREAGEKAWPETHAEAQRGGGAEGVANSECRAKDPAHCRTHGTPEGKHTREEEKRIVEYRDAVDQGLVDFVRKCEGIEDGAELSRQKYPICKASPEFGNRVKELTGLDTTGWTIEMRGERVRHLDLRHGKSGKQDQSLADVNDIGRIGYVMQHFDSMDVVRDEKGQQVFSGQYVSKGGNPTPMVEVRMKIDGTYAVQEAVPDSKWKKIYVVSARIEKPKEP